MIRRALALVVVASVLAPAALADDWKFDPKSRPKAKVGHKKTDEGETNQKEASSVSVAEQGEVNKQDKEDKVVFKLHREVKAVDDKARITEEVITVEKWVRTATGEPEDRSLEGQKIVIVKKDGSKSYTLPDDKDHKVSPGARGWIDEYYAKKKKHKKAAEEEKDEDHDDDDAGAAKFFPKTPVADGEEWAGDPAELAREIFGEGDLVDAAKSSVKGKLSKVRVVDGLHHGLIEVKIHLKLKSLPNMPKEMAFEWTEGGDFHMTVAVEGCLELEKLGGGTFKITGALKGEAKFNAQGQDATLKMDVKQKIEVKTTPARDDR